MLPVIEGIVARRILLNFRTTPEVARLAVPLPLHVPTVGPYAMVGVCLIRLEKIRPKGLPALVGMSSENMAHRFAIRFETDGRLSDGVFVARRDTDSTFVHLLGGRLFPGYHRQAEFVAEETAEGLSMDIQTLNGTANVRLRARWTGQWQGSEVFRNLSDASEFYRQGSCGFSCGRDGRTLEGLRLEMKDWRVQPLEVIEVSSAFFGDRGPFPPGSVVFDHALLMRGVPHEWHELRHVPELAGDF